MFLQTLLGDSGYQHRPALPLEASPKKTTRPGWHELQDTSLGSVTHCCSCSPLLASQPASPPLQSHSYSSRLAESPHFHTLPHSEGAKRGRPAYKNHTTSQQLHSTRSPQTFEHSTEESKHRYTPHTRQSLPLPKAIRKAASHLQKACRQTVCPNPGHPARSAWPPHLPAISIGFSLFRLSLLPASEICAPKAAFRSRSVSLPVLRDLKRGHIT